MTLQDIQSVDLGRAALDALMPMHLLIERDGRVLSAGPTLQKLIARRPANVSDDFIDGRPSGATALVSMIVDAARHGERLFLRMRAVPFLNLRGHAVPAGDGLILLNLGFGIGLADAVHSAGLTDRDFAPPELAMELLFLREAMGGVLGELSHFNDQLEAAREAAELQAHTDPLTGLSNRRGLELALIRARRLASERGQGDRGFALAHLDLDHFKQVNDLLGHAAGDRVLCHVAKVLREVTRCNDTAARIGGDEFIMIFQGLEDGPTIERLTARIISGIEAAMCARTEGCAVSASVGVVLSRGYRDLTLERMLADADAALYRSKRDGRGRVTILHEPLPLGD